MPGLEDILERAGLEPGGEDSCNPANEELAEVRSELRQSIGKIPVSCRYHLPPRNISDSYVVSTGELGSGMCGTVVRATCQHTGKAHAVKQFQLNDLSADEVDRIKAEISVYLSLDHPHVVRLYDVFESGKFLSLVMECMEGGELSQCVETQNLSNLEKSNIARQILLAVNYLHQNGVTHRDLKHKNIMFETRDGMHVKVLDFGLSKLDLGMTPMTSRCGTEAYMAPEILGTGDGYTSKCDLWSIGVIVFHMLTGRMPLSGGLAATQLQAEKEIHPDALDFTSALLKVDPNERLSSKQALEHLWIKSSQTEPKAIRPSIVQDLRAFGDLSRLQRCCLLIVALSLSTQDRAKVRDYFTILDQDHEGTIDLREFRAEPTLAEVTAEGFDRNSARKGSPIHYSEYLAAVIPSHIQTSDELLTCAFRRFDQESPGLIAVSHLKEVFQNSFEGEKLSCHELDAEGTGQVSYESFVACVRASRREAATAKCCILS